MKSNYISILTLAASLMLLPCCHSCSENNPDVVAPDNKEEIKDDGKPKAGDYSFTVSPMKGKWKAGDQIYVHGSYGPAAKTFTLKASDISADGKTATLRLGTEMMEYISAPDYLYAAYPASVVKEEDGLMDATTVFVKADILLAQAYLQGKTFAFDDASALISFTVTGDYDRVSIAGADRGGLRFTSYTNSHSTAQTSFVKVSNDGYPFREVSVKSGEKVNVWFPGGITMDGGLSLYMGKGDEWTEIYTYEDNIKLKAGKSLDLGDITSSLKPYDGPAPRMPEMGNRTKYTVKFNELSGLCLSSDKTFLWTVGDDGEIARLSLEGELLGKAGLKTTSGSSIDSEGISVNYETGDLLIGGEPASVCQIDQESIGDIFKASTYKGVKGLFTIADAKNFGNSGLEGLTYYKDGKVYCGTQTGSYLFCCDLKTGEVVKKIGLREKYPVITEIAGLSYDPLTDWLWIVDSESRRFFALTGDGETLLGFYSCKGIENPESIYVDHAHSCVWIGDDYGSTSYLYRYDFKGLDDYNIKD